MLIVKKFGGTSVGNKERILNVAKRCIEDYQKGNDVVVVLSAMGKSTDELIDMAKDINPTPSKREMDMLMTTGEQVSVSLMAMAMGSLGVPAISLNAFQVAMHTTHRYGNAQLKRIDTDRIRNELEQRKIVLVTSQVLRFLLNILQQASPRMFLALGVAGLILLRSHLVLIGINFLDFILYIVHNRQHPELCFLADHTFQILRDLCLFLQVCREIWCKMWMDLHPVIFFHS